MAAGTPLTRLTLGAASVADDLGYVALTDLARALGELTEDYRVIGGHMVTVLAARWQLGHDLYREPGGGAGRGGRLARRPGTGLSRGGGSVSGYVVCLLRSWLVKA